MPLVPFVNLGDAAVADQLFHAMLADIAVTAEHLHAEIGGLEAEIGEQGFDDRRHQGDEIVGVLTLLFFDAMLGHIELMGHPGCPGRGSPRCWRGWSAACAAHRDDG